MKIGLIGLGMVGKAIYEGLKLNKNNEMYFYDVKFPESKITDVINTDLVYIAVPTLPDMNNKCDLSILNNVIEQLINLNYNGMICIKSTITPETTINLINKYNNDKICFCPEFLRERCAFEDFTINNKICIIGTLNKNAYELIKLSHENICNEFKMVHPTEAELTKYFQNVYNTNRILFANAFYEVCKKNNVEYNNIINNLLVRKEIDDKYIRCDDNLRGPSGPCLVKDTLAFNEYVKTLNLEIKPNLFSTLVEDMKLYPRTVISGTRTEQEYFGKELNKNN
jgi:UDPglucose 6-dehydrogenase